MIASLVCLALSQLDDLARVDQAVSKLPGVFVEAEMLRSGVRIEYKIAPGGFCYVKYPTTEWFYSQRELVTWFPDRREFAKEKAADENPLPFGFSALWPKSSPFKQSSPSRTVTFAGQEAVEIPCEGDGQAVRLYVNPKTWLPVGTVAVAGGKEYERHYITVRPSRFSVAELTFKAPADAKPFSGGPKDLERLIKPGASFPSFTGKDSKGTSLNLKDALVRHPKGLVVNFWFASCTGCVAEMPYLAKLSRTLEGRQIGLIGVNAVDAVKDAKRTIERNSLPYPTLLGDPARKLMDATGVVAHPVTVVLDPKGTVIDSMIGFDQTRLEKAIDILQRFNVGSVNPAVDKGVCHKSWYYEKSKLTTLSADIPLFQ